MISPAQCREARAALGWDEGRLAEAAKLSRQAVEDFERGARTPRPDEVAALRRALEAAGIGLTEAKGEDLPSTPRRYRSVDPEDEERGQQAGPLPFNRRDD